MKTANSESGWKTHRSELRSHIRHFHGEFPTDGIKTVDKLEDVHEALHIDGYMCPPHSHDKETREVKIDVPDDYVDLIRGEIGGVR